jgi:hypothetical protein
MGHIGQARLGRTAPRARSIAVTIDLIDRFHAAAVQSQRA